MKTFGKFNFGIQAVQAGQKNATVNAEPQLIANCSASKFTITSPVSKALNVAVGENIMFLNNIAAVEAAVQSRNSDVVAYAEEIGVDLNSRDGEDKLIDALTQWFIAKGVPQYKSNGEPLMASSRYTTADKNKYLAEHAMELVEANRDALIEQFGTMSDEELASKLTVDMVESPKYHAASGSKTTTSSSTTGVGCQLTFTDSSIWNNLKKDLGENATKKNRVFDVLIDEAQETEFNNGKEIVTITVLPISFKADVDPVIRNKKAE